MKKLDNRITLANLLLNSYLKSIDKDKVNIYNENKGKR